MIFASLLCVALLVLAFPRMADLAVRPTRMVAPPPGRPQLELVHWPLYSALALTTSNLPRSSRFFTYAVGNTVSGTGPGAVAATQFHTNLETPNILAAPKTFTVEGVRMHFLPLIASNSPTIADTTGAAIASDDAFDDAMKVVNSCVIRFFVGPKDYCQSPLFSCPGNWGLGGISATNVSSTNAASVFQRRTAVHSSGRGFDMNNFPVLIANQQSFGAELLCEFATNPTLAQARYLFCVLDGILGREVL